MNYGEEKLKYCMREDPFRELKGRGVDRFYAGEDY
jgi:hypothetical protein